MQKPFHLGFPHVIVNYLTPEAISIAKFLGMNTIFPPDDCGGVKSGMLTVHAWGFAFENMGIELEKDGQYDFYPDRTGRPFYQSIVDAIGRVESEAEARFISAAVAVCILPQDKERVLARWDGMLQRLGLSASTIDFDIAEYLGLPRHAQAA